MIRPRGQRLRILVILAHPRRESLCGALADAYCAGAVEAGVDLKRMDLGALAFDLNVRMPSPRDQPVETAIQEAMDAVAWADHLVLVFPTWWGTMPALLKGFLDRVLMPGFAFADREHNEGWVKLLDGRTAHLITTMDTPPLVYRWIYGAPGLNGLAKATLGFCGIGPVRRSIFGPVKESTPVLRERWLAAAHAAGAALRNGPLSTWGKLWQQVKPWLAALRLQFHPMAWAAYWIGAAGVTAAGGADRPLAFWLGLFCLFFLEAATVFTNEYFDFESDRRNDHYGPFTGGARVLVEGRISKRHILYGTGILLLALILCGAWLVRLTPGPTLPFLAGFAVLALGYTVPPLKLCWRSLGEVDVALTHSFGALLLGTLSQGGSLADLFPWLVATPIFWSVLPAIILSGVPDYEADRACGKKSLAVRFGPKTAVFLAEGATVLAAVTALFWIPALGARFSAVAIVVPTLYALFQLRALDRYRKSGVPPRRIDLLMQLCLGFILALVIPPLIHLG
jgi:1,4-dihydroxy-2-naphthoate octaprenyltransferase